MEKSKDWWGAPIGGEEAETGGGEVESVEWQEI